MHKTSLIVVLLSALLGAIPLAEAVSTRIGISVGIAPPAQRIEHRPAAPGRHHIWIDGHWRWDGREYVWVPGHWQRARPGQKYVPARWVRHGSQWRFHAGYWRK